MQASVTYGSYELNPSENAVVSKTAGRAKLWGIIGIVMGALHVLLGFGAIARPALAIYFVAGIIEIVIGAVFLGLAAALRAVVDTQGQDMPNLMKALEKLGTAFTIQIVVTVVGFVLGVALAVVSVLLAVASHAS